jgi:hypothetical protein
MITVPDKQNLDGEGVELYINIGSSTFVHELFATSGNPINSNM